MNEIRADEVIRTNLSSELGDVYLFKGTKGLDLTLILSSDAFDTVLELELFDKIINQNSEYSLPPGSIDSKFRSNSLIHQKLPVDGDYIVRVISYDNPQAAIGSEYILRVFTHQAVQHNIRFGESKKLSSVIPPNSPDTIVYHAGERDLHLVSVRGLESSKFEMKIKDGGWYSQASLAESISTFPSPDWDWWHSMLCMPQQGDGDYEIYITPKASHLNLPWWHKEGNPDYEVTLTKVDYEAAFLKQGLNRLRFRYHVPGRDAGHIVALYDVFSFRDDSIRPAAYFSVDSKFLPRDVDRSNEARYLAYTEGNQFGTGAKYGRLNGRTLVPYYGPSWGYGLRENIDYMGLIVVSFEGEKAADISESDKKYTIEFSVQ